MRGPPSVYILKAVWVYREELNERLPSGHWTREYLLLSTRISVVALHCAGTSILALKRKILCVFGRL
jgi:hypothetical protein